MGWLPLDHGASSGPGAGARLSDRDFGALWCRHTPVSVHSGVGALWCRCTLAPPRSDLVPALMDEILVDFAPMDELEALW